MFGRISFLNAISGHNSCGQQSADGSDLKKKLPFVAIRSKRVTIGSADNDNIRVFDLKTVNEDFQIEIIVSNNENAVNSHEFFIRSVKGTPCLLNGVPLIVSRKLELKNNDRLSVGHNTWLFNKCMAPTQCLSPSKPQQTSKERTESDSLTKNIDTIEEPTEKICDSEPIVITISPNVSTIETEVDTKTIDKTDAEPIQPTNAGNETLTKGKSPKRRKTEVKEEVLSTESRVKTESSGISIKIESIEVKTPQNEDKTPEKVTKTRGRRRQESSDSPLTRRTRNKTEVELKVELNETIDDRVVTETKPKPRGRPKLSTTPEAKTDNKSKVSTLKPRKTRNQMKSESNEPKISEKCETKSRGKRPLKTGQNSGHESNQQNVKQSKKVEFSPNIETFGEKCSKIEDKVSKKGRPGAKRSRNAEQESKKPSLESRKAKFKTKQLKRKTINSQNEDKIAVKSSLRGKRAVVPDLDSCEPVLKTRNKAKNTKTIEQKCIENNENPVLKPNKRPKRGVKELEETKKRSLRSRTDPK